MFRTAIRKVLRVLPKLRNKEKRSGKRSERSSECIQGIQQPNLALHFLNGFGEEAGKNRKRSSHKKRGNNENQETREKSK